MPSGTPGSGPRLRPDLGTLTLLVEDFVIPNGLAFSPDEKILYVNDSRRRIIRAVDLNPNGGLARQSDRVFADLGRRKLPPPPVRTVAW
jgi:gluconolactonase